MREAHALCLAAIAEHYGLQPPPAVASAVAAAMRASFDLGCEFTYQKSTIPPPAPVNREAVEAAESEIRALRGSRKPRKKGER
jgi:hypothetical protein